MPKTVSSRQGSLCRLGLELRTCRLLCSMQDEKHTSVLLLAFVNSSALTEKSFKVTFMVTCKKIVFY